MRYIDANELIEFFDSYPDHIEFDVEDIKSIINEQDAADVRENVQLDVCPLYGGVCGYPSGECYDCPRHGNFRENIRGRWVEVVDRTEMYDKEGVKTWGSLCQCNKCGFVLNAVEGHIGQYNFCPNCGADMRGDNNG